MRSENDQRTALECLKLAHNPEAPVERVVQRATAFYTFVTGKELDDAKRKIDAVR